MSTTKSKKIKVETVPFAKIITAETNRKHLIALANETNFKPRVPRLPAKDSSIAVSGGQIPVHTWVGYVKRMTNWSRAFSIKHPEKVDQISKFTSHLV